MLTELKQLGNAIAAPMVVAIIAGACQDTGITAITSDLSTAAKRGAKTPATEPRPTATVEPIEDASLLELDRAYFQTYSVMTIHVRNLGASESSSLSLVNDTTSALIIDQQSLLAGGVELDHQRANLSLGASYEITLTLYPKQDIVAEKFTYGENRLRLLIDEDSIERFAQSTIYFVDFPVMSIDTLAFPDPASMSAGLWGGVGAMTHPVGLNRTTVLTTGFIPIISH